MNGVSILLLLVSGVVVIQGGPFSSANTNVNSNVNTHRRNLNTNSNTNFLQSIVPRPVHYRDDDYSIRDLSSTDRVLSPLQQIHDKLFAEGNVKTAAAVSAAAEAALSITKSLIIDLSEATAIAVADAVAHILDDSYFNGLGTAYRRNVNHNTNSNTNIIRRGEGRNVGRFIADDPLIEELDSDIVAEGDESHQYPEVIIPDGPINLLPRLRDNDDVENEEISAGDLTPDEEVIEPDTRARRAWARAHRRNTNLNSNSNHLWRPTAYRRNVNSNSNRNSFRRNNLNANSNVNHFRRNNVNANSNVNKFRRSNVNSNSNNNKIHAGYPWGRK